MKKLITILILLVLTFTVNAQIDLQDKLKGAVNPDELVSLSETITFDQAIQVLSKVSEKITGKKIISTVNLTTPIGVEIDKWPYKKALFVIVQYNNLIVDETESTVIIKRKDESKTKLAKETYAPIDEREVKISAVLFEANIDDLRERGINWEFLLSQSGLSIGTKIITLQEQQQQQASSATSTTIIQKPPTYEINNSTNFTTGKWDGTATGLFRFLETNNLGEIIARPIITARDGVEGKTQIGNDFSIKERDFAGNLIDKFYPTGTIITATPHIFNEQGITYVLLKLNIERSSVVARDALSTNVSKNVVTTDVLLLDGEETAIGGLFENQEISVRRGIPFLKDLPWWVFGIRYLTGYDSQETVRKEVIMLIKAELLPSLKDRIEKIKEDSALRDIRQENFDKMEKYKKQFEKKEDPK
ncbi:MAG: type II secretion system protein GspD [Melioribacteraceae bacterium]